MIRLTRPKRLPALLLAGTAMLGLLAAACGGGDGDADATPAPIASPGDLQSFRFALTMEIGGMGAPTGSPGVTTDTSFNVDASGSFVAPDRAQAAVSADLGFIQVDLETIGIGDQTWTREPGGEWTLGGGAADELGLGDLGNPADILAAEEDEEAFRELQTLLDRLEGERESVNGVNAMRYNLTQADLEELSQDPELASMFEGFEELGDTKLDMSMWFDIATGVPVKVEMSGTSTEEGVEGTVRLEFNLTDLNSDIEIEPPA
jgi:hypothetical protein